MWTSILGGLLFILVFAGSILLHELGHFVVARALKIEVDEFGIGFPPRIVKLFSWRGTDFTLNWIPLGGFNRIKGEDDPSVPGGMAAANPWKRILVLLAGASMNLLTGVFAFTLLYSQVGIPQTKRVELASVQVASPAQLSGFQTGDELLTFNGIKVTGVEQVRSYTRAHLDQPITFGLRRGGKDLTLTVTPLSSRSAQQGAMGVVLSNPVLPAGSWFATVPLSFESTGQFIGELLSLPGQIISGAVPAQDAQIGGPRTIWNMFQQSVARDVQSRATGSAGSGTPAQPTNYTLFVIINLTISLGVINLLPIPALDGGRIFMSLPEILMRRRIPAKYQTMINGIGFIILLTLLGFFYIKDIISPVNFTLP
jgi:regulator of sigma E protease